MDLDKIVSDLVEKRFEDELIRATTSEMECQGMYPGSGYHDKLRQRIQKIMDEVIEEKVPEIRALLRKVVEEGILQAQPISTFKYGIDLNLPLYKVQGIYYKMKEEEKKNNEEENKKIMGE